MRWEISLGALPMVFGLAFSATQANAAACTVTDFNAGLQTSDVTMTVGASPTQEATQCHGVNEGNLNENEEQDLLNTLYGSPNFDTYIKSEGAGETESLDGLDLTLSFGDGTWDLFVEGIDPNGSVTLDIAVLLKQGQGSGTWFFDDVTFTDTDGDGNANGDGTFIIRWCTAQGQLTICEEPITDLSHFSLVARLDSTQVPEPGSLLLMVLGLAGLALTQRLRHRFEAAGKAR